MPLERHARKTPTTLEKLRVMVRQALCPLCGQKLGKLEETQFDHQWALVNGGDNDLDNLRAVHVDCHKIKTHGNGATNRGSDRGEASKSARMERKRLEREAAARRAQEESSDFYDGNSVAPEPNSGKSKPKRPIRSANRWPPKKPKVPYKRRGV